MKTIPSTAKPAARSGICVRVADGDRVEREEQRADEGHGQEDDAGRDAATGGGHADAPNVL